MRPPFSVPQIRSLPQLDKNVPVTFFRRGEGLGQVALL
jgi:hypothetical protein